MHSRGQPNSANSASKWRAALLATLAGTALSAGLTHTAWAQGAQTARASTGAPSATQAAISAYLAGRNAEAARLGLVALEQDPDNHDLRLKTANALAWTSQYPEALRQYEALLKTPLKDEGTLGLANVNLWSGRAHVAATQYSSLLATNAANGEATEGLKKAKNQLRPRTEIRAFTLKDSEDSERNLLGISHQWRSDDAKRVYEVTVEGGREIRGTEVSDLKPRDMAFTVEDFSLPLSPKLKVEMQDSPVRKGFAELGLKLADEALTLDVGHVNWAKVAFNPLSRRDGLAANKVGISGRYNTSIGHISGTYTRYAISDNNVVKTAAAEYWPAWQPLPSSSGIKVFTGLYSYKADRNDARYWSPAAGHSIAFIGAAYGVWEKEYEIYAVVKRSVLIGGEGAGGAHISMGGKRWLNKDWAVRAEAFLLNSGRSGQSYRSRSFTVAVDRYW